ncbi:hypothetical protein ACWIGW_44440 [Nocardia brasiliensis]|uniref:hypothetical protein n=1 Tax=Streptomyces sp. NPDC056056 TaxID=3345698 RepID=UPI0035E34E47
MQNHTYQPLQDPYGQYSPMFDRDLLAAGTRRGGPRSAPVHQRSPVPVVIGAVSVGLAAGFVAGFLTGWRSATEWL